MDERAAEIWKEIQAEVNLYESKLPEEKSVEDFVQEVGGNISRMSAREYLNRLVKQGKLKKRLFSKGKIKMNLYSPIIKS